VQVPDNKDVANHVVPESCAAHREVRREALTGVRIGQPLSRDRSLSWVPTLFHLRKATRTGAFTQALARPGAVVEPGMCARSLRGNREISGLTSRSTGLARIGKARSRSR
jgi:hypothetical protein